MSTTGATLRQRTMEDRPIPAAVGQTYFVMQLAAGRFGGASVWRGRRMKITVAVVTFIITVLMLR